MKTVINFFGLVLCASILFWSCRSAETVLTTDASAPDCYVKIGNEVDLPAEINAFLNEEEIEDFVSGPGYDWLPQDGARLSPDGEWKRVVAYQAINPDENKRLKTSVNSNAAFMTQTAKGPSEEDKTILLEEDHGVLVFRDMVKSENQSLARLVSSEKSNKPMGYVKRRTIPSSTDNALTQTLLYGWIYTNSQAVSI